MKVLVVEDEIGISNFIRLSLEAERYVVEEVTDGAEALERMKYREYDAIILDHELPSMVGLEVCRAAREVGVTSRIIGVSVRSQTSDKVAFLSAGADDYLTKPFAIEELRARLSALLRRPAEVKQDVLEVGDLSLHTRTHRVFRGTDEVKLTRKEFMLLDFFMRNRGIVLSRSMILEHVWDVNTDPFTYTIEAHVMSIRKKLGDKDRTLIETISGSGYRLGV